MSVATAPVSIIEWHIYQATEGYECSLMDIPRWLGLAVLAERDAAYAEPSFTSLTVEYCDALVRSPFRLLLVRYIYDEVADTWREAA